MQGRQGENLTAEGIVCEPSVCRALRSMCVCGWVRGDGGLMIGNELGEEETWGTVEGLQQWEATAVSHAGE